MTHGRFAREEDQGYNHPGPINSKKSISYQLGQSSRNEADGNDELNAALMERLNERNEYIETHGEEHPDFVEKRPWWQIF